MMNSTDNKLKGYLILFFSVIVGMWWLSTFSFTMKWDIMDITLPWNFYISECIRDGQLPLWNSFVNNGFPQFGLPDTLYPVHLLLGYLFGFDVFIIQLDYLLHLLIGGIGIWKYSVHKKINNDIGIALGICYMFSGFMIANAQHLGWIIGAAWLPWVLLNFEQVLKKSTIYNAIKFGLISSLMFLGAYIPITILTMYLLMSKLIYSTYKNGIKQSQSSYKCLGFAAVVSILISSVGLIGVLEIQPYLNRSDALPLTDTGWGVLTGFFPWEALSSFVLPYAGTAVEGSWGSDISLINTYIGFIPMLFLLLAFWAKVKPSGFLRYVLIACLCMMVALSDIFPFREWLYHTLPLMDRFRFPSLFRLFTIYFLLLASGLMATELLKAHDNRLWIRFLSASLFVILCLTFYFYTEVDLHIFNLLISDGLQSFSQEAGFAEKAMINLLIHLIVITILLLSTNRKRFKTILLSLIGIEILLAAQFNISETVIHFESPATAQTQLQSFKGKKISTDLTLPLITFEDGYWSKDLSKFRFNQACITKTPSAGGSSPFSLKSRKEAIVNGDINIISEPLLFLSNSANTNPDSSIGTIDLLKYDHNIVELKIKANESCSLTFLQNYFPYWSAYVDGKSTSIDITHTTFMKVPIQEGEHSVHFKFEANKIKIAFWISFLSFFACVIYLSSCIIRGTKLKNEIQSSV